MVANATDFFNLKYNIYFMSALFPLTTLFYLFLVLVNDNNPGWHWILSRYAVLFKNNVSVHLLKVLPTSSHKSKILMFVCVRLRISSWSGGRRANQWLALWSSPSRQREGTTTLHLTSSSNWEILHARWKCIFFRITDL